MSRAIRLAGPDDLPAINDIYNFYVHRSTCTYQETSEPIESRYAWFERHGPAHPITVAELDGQVGYKFDRWLDVVYMPLRIAARAGA